jgi:U3 small nucleolar RNA-associated protein 20
VDDEETTESFFKAALEKWVELNLSTTFTLFTREITPLSESLPIILHNQDKIFEVLYIYIDKRDALALEPLLDLLAQLAHDLGANFERYLERSVTLLSSIVAKYVDVQTIEWTFNCLAYLLKYLSRLLVPDLRPLYDVLAPLLGRENQKSFVTRFAAEALSFLVRKAKGDSLWLIVRHAFEDLQKNHSRPDVGAYSLGLMTMFHEACISVDRTVHSRGPQVFRAMLELTLELPVAEGACLGVVQGVLTGLIHHTMAETFKPILEVLLEFTGSELLKAPADSQKIKMAATLLYTCVSVRKGHRIKDWSAIGDVAQRVVEAAHAVPSDDEKLQDATWETLKFMAVVLQTAEIDVVISKCSRAVEKAKDFQVRATALSCPWQNADTVQDGALFLPFCEFVAGLGQERFVTFVLPYLQR